MMKIRLTERLTRKEVEVALACGARDEVDFVALFQAYSGLVTEISGKAGWGGERVLRALGRKGGGLACWLFEEIEDDDE